MSKNWTIEEARNYVAKVQKGKQQAGLTYCSAIDFLMNHTASKMTMHSLARKEGENDNFESDD